jgi:hypothetical protein
MIQVHRYWWFREISRGMQCTLQSRIVVRVVREVRTCAARAQRIRNAPGSCAERLPLHHPKYGQAIKYCTILSSESLLVTRDVQAQIRE